jgi:flagellin
VIQIKEPIMSVVINTNTAATTAAANLAKTNSLLQKSLGRLSSGSRLVNSADDAAGLGVSMKLSAAIRRTSAASNSVANAVSLLQVQDGALKIAGDVLDRISELAGLYQDVTKSTADKANYDLEFTALRNQLNSLVDEKFNGVSLFTAGAGTTATTLLVTISEDGSQNQTVTQANLISAAVQSATQADDSTIASALSLSTLVGTNTTLVTSAIESVANMRAQNGAEASRLGFAADLLSVNKTNLEAANSRIADVDVAQESTQLAKYNILQQAGTAMLAQANVSTQSVLRLLQ